MTATNLSESLIFFSFIILGLILTFSGFMKIKEYIDGEHNFSFSDSILKLIIGTIFSALGWNHVISEQTVIKNDQMLNSINYLDYIYIGIGLMTTFIIIGGISFFIFSNINKNKEYKEKLLSEKRKNDEILKYEKINKEIISNF